MRGWSGYVLKEKLKILKNKLKEWNRDCFENLNQRLKEVENEFQDWDLNGENAVLSDDEVETLFPTNLLQQQNDDPQNSP